MGPMKTKTFTIWPLKKSLLIYNSTIHFQISAMMETFYVFSHMTATNLTQLLNTWNVADVN